MMPGQRNAYSMDESSEPTEPSSPHERLERFVQRVKDGWSARGAIGLEDDQFAQDVNALLAEARVSSPQPDIDAIKEAISDLRLAAKANGHGWITTTDAWVRLVLSVTRMSDRSTFLLLSDFERVEEWCRGIRILFGSPPYMVGSALKRADYRDIDLRLIVPDKTFDRQWRNPVKVRLMNRAISTWGQRETGLPIDFQIQRQSAANERWPGGARNAMGVRDWSVIVPDATREPPREQEKRK